MYFCLVQLFSTNKFFPGYIYSAFVGLLEEQIYRSSQCPGLYFDYERGICSVFCMTKETWYLRFCRGIEQFSAFGFCVYLKLDYFFVDEGKLENLFR